METPSLSPSLQSAPPVSTAQVALKSLPIISIETPASSPSNNLLPAPTSAPDKFTGLFHLLPLFLSLSWNFILSPHPHSFCSAPVLTTLLCPSPGHLFSFSSQGSSCMKQPGCDTKPWLPLSQVLSKIWGKIRAVGSHVSVRVGRDQEGPEPVPGTAWDSHDRRTSHLGWGQV